MLRIIPLTFYFLLLAGFVASAAEPREKELAFFESRIRPVLVDACYECHSTAGKQEGNLTLDDRAGLLRGGDRGPAIVPGQAEKSLLIDALRHTTDDLRMPRGGAKLKPAVLADFVTWINTGAFDPREKPPTPAELAEATSWEKVRERRRQWWSFQPLQVTEPPMVSEARWNQQAIDRFVRAQQLAAGVSPTEQADPATRLRRLSLLLNGVPPTPQEVRAFLEDASPAAYERAVDRLLASPRFGETWARHWMDWFRYAESHGSEGDPVIPHAWRYRDYLIRALNDDISYQQLIREHVAGDLLPNPRINQELKIRESALGIGHLRMVQHGYAPTDPHDDRVRVIDNQIDVLSKAFLGLTVSCARCHNHKFDPISQEDFYAWYGILGSCHPGTIVVDTPAQLQLHQTELLALKANIRQELAKAWMQTANDFGKQQLLQRPVKAPESNKDSQSAKKETIDFLHPFAAWEKLRGLQGEALAKAWQTWLEKQAAEQAKEAQLAATNYPVHWKLSGPDYEKWFKHGNALPQQASAAGEFHLLAEGDRILSNIYPAGAFTHLVSSKQAGVLISPRFKIDCDELWVRVAGGNNARVRYVIQNYPRVVLIYPHAQLTSENATWHKWSTRYWKGEWAHIELVTGEDQPLDIGSQEGRSWFGALEVIGRNQDQPAPVERLPLLIHLLTAEERKHVPQSDEDLAQLYTSVCQRAVRDWQAGTLSDAQADWLGYLIRREMLPNTIKEVPAIASALAEYRRLEKALPVPTRAPGVHEGEPFNQPLYERGNPLEPTAPVARRFLEVFNSRPYETNHSGRLQLADSLSDAHNPLVSRVIVNRIWQQLFGRGMVSTPDNFGKLGEEPTHPELLDYLAAQFSGQAKTPTPHITPWSLKSLIKTLVLTETFQQSSTLTATAKQADADNRYLTRFALRRLSAEGIRDSLVAVSVGLDETRLGPSVANQSYRRGVYLPFRRNSLDPFLSTFDCPEPVSTVGRRDNTNVPAQSLTLLNDPFVINLAQAWATRILADKTLQTDAERVRTLLFTAVGREPSQQEITAALQFMQLHTEQHRAWKTQLTGIEQRMSTVQERIQATLEPLRKKLLSERKGAEKTAEQHLPQPFARWEFNGDLRDSLGSLHGEMFTVEGAKTDSKQALTAGSLILDGRTYVKTAVLAKELTAKTLEAWVSVSSLEQRGGGVMSLETPGGNAFDAIVFGEQEPRRWMAGSDFFRRTKSFGGEAETQTAQDWVHVAITYSEQGKIRCYRNGKLYGSAYDSTPQKFAAGKSQILFGLRHSPAANNKLWQGRIERAQLYDRALTDEEIAMSAGALNDFISREKLLAALTEEQRVTLQQQENELAKLNAEMQSLVSETSKPDEELSRWRDLCQSLFNWKEFLYLR